VTSTARPDVIVVGSGIIGIACAHYLSAAGLRVTVIDQGTIGGACSHGNCGYICPSHVLPLTEPGAIGTALKSLFNPQAPFRVKPRMSSAMAKWMWHFARRCNHGQMLAAGQHLKAILDSSMREYKRLMHDEGLPCEWKEIGLLYVLKTEHGMDDFAKTDRLLTEHFGVAARRIEGRDLAAFDPALKPGLAGAFHYPNDASVRPDLLNASWSQRLRERGVNFIEHCQLQRFEKSKSRVVQLATSQGTLQADRIVEIRSGIKRIELLSKSKLPGVKRIALLLEIGFAEVGAEQRVGGVEANSHFQVTTALCERTIANNGKPQAETGERVC